MGNESLYLKGDIHCYTLHIMLLSPEPRAVNQRKIIKSKRHTKKGGKIKVGVSHAPHLLPPIHYISRCGLPFISYSCTPTCGPGLPLSFPIPFISLSHATTIWRMYLGHTAPFKSRNHLIGYLVNPPWNLETLAHAKAHYGRACHYEVPTFRPRFVSSLTRFL